MNQVFQVAALLLAVNIFTGCTDAPDLSGSGSQTTNGITVMVQNDTCDIITQQPCIALLLSSDYSPFDQSGTITRDTGIDYRCSFFMKKSQTYNLLVSDTTGSVSVFFDGIAVLENSTRTLSGNLSRGSDIHGTVRLENQPAAGVNLFIYGTPFIVMTDAQGQYRFTGLPEGTFRITARQSTEKPGSEFTIPDPVIITGEEKEILVPISIE